MVVKRRLLLVVASALTLVMTAAAPMLGAARDAAPDPLRQENLLRVKDIAANGNTNKGAIVAVGWHEASKPGQLFLAFSVDGGKSYNKSNGKLRRYPVVGDPALGMSLGICSGRVWAGTSYPTDAGQSDVFMTSRTVGGGAAQALMTNSADDRRVRDVAVACVGSDLLAIAWLEKSGGKNRARLMLRSMEQLGTAPAFKTIYNLGTAEFKNGIAVAATPDAVGVAFVRDGDLHFKRFGIGGDAAPEVEPEPTVKLAWNDIKGPVMAARGNRFVVAYADAGKIKTKLSMDAAASFIGPKVLVSSGGIKKPSKAHTADVVADRIVVTVSANKKGDITPQRIQSTNAGETWGTRSYGNVGARTAALLKKKGKDPLLQEAWHNNAPKGSRDTLRARYETR